MRIVIILVFIIFISYSCSSDRSQNTNAIASSDVDTFPIDFIKQNSIERRMHYNMDSVHLNKLVLIDSVFFKKCFANRKLDNSDFTIVFDPFSRYYFFDFKEFETKILFSIIHNDEVGYDNLYHFVFDNKNRKIIQSDFISSNGGDGGQSNLDILDFNQSGDLLKLTSVFIEDIDFDKGYTRHYDSTVSNIEFGLDNTKIIKVDSVTRVDTIWSRK